MSYDEHHWNLIGASEPREKGSAMQYGPEYRIGMLDHIVDGLAKAVDLSYISEAEARAQLRSMLPVVAEADMKMKQADRLRHEADELDAEATQL